MSSNDVEPRPVQFTMRGLFLFVAGCALLFGILRTLWIGVDTAREAARGSLCHGRLHQMAMAFHNYHDVNGCFPPAYLADADGRPMHSWRVLLLPYIEQNAIYDAYDFNESWNGPNNRKLADKLFPNHFQCPSGPQAGNSPITDYVVIVGPRTAFPGNECTSFEDFRDGGENTILMVEIANSDIHWMEPRDLNFDQMGFVVNDPDKPSISAPHSAGPMVVFADRRCRRIRLREPLRAATLKALITVDGREGIVRDEIEQWDY